MVTSLATAPVISSAAFVAVALTREADATSLNAANYAAFDIDTRAIDAAPAPSTVVGPGCVWGGGMRAFRGTIDVATDQDWRALECTRHNRFLRGAALLRTAPGATIRRSGNQQLQLEVFVTRTCWSITETDLGELRDAANTAVSLIFPFVDSSAHLLAMQCNMYRSPHSGPIPGVTHGLWQTECK